MADPGSSPSTPADALGFNGALYWYVAIQAFLASAMALSFFLYFFLSAYLRLVDISKLHEQAAALDKAMPPIIVIVTLASCILVARRHRTGFWPGVALWFLGNFTSFIVVLPMFALALYVDANPSIGLGACYFATILAYLGTSGLLMLRWRRRSLTILSQRNVAEVFD
jgi:hypothetical protein